MGDTKSPPRLRSRQCMFVLYPESQQAAIDYCKHNLPCAWALHDKDVHSQASFDAYVKKHEGEPPDWMPGDLKKPHVHFVCSFANARYFSGIAKEIGVEVNVIRKVNNLYKAYVYLWHMLDPDKYQYSKDIVGTHEFEEPSEHAGMSQMEDDQVQILLDMPTFDTFNELCRWAYGLIPTELATFWANVWYKTFGKNATAVKAPSGIGRKDLPGFEDEEGTAQVSKEGKLTYVVHPRLVLSDGNVSVPYQNFYKDGEYHSDTCKQTGNHTSSCWHTQISFNYNQYNYDYIAVDVLRHTRTYAYFRVVYEIQDGVPGTYYAVAGQPYFRYRKSLGADETIFYITNPYIEKLPTENNAYDKYGISRYIIAQPQIKTYSAAKGEDVKARVYRLLVTCDPDESTITSDTNITITNNTCRTTQALCVPLVTSIFWAMMQKML